MLEEEAVHQLTNENYEKANLIYPNRKKKCFFVLQYTTTRRKYTARKHDKEEYTARIHDKEGVLCVPSPPFSYIFFLT